MQSRYTYSLQHTQYNDMFECVWKRLFFLILFIILSWMRSFAYIVIDQMCNNAFIHVTRTTYTKWKYIETTKDFLISLVRQNFYFDWIIDERRSQNNMSNELSQTMWTICDANRFMSSIWKEFLKKKKFKKTLYK